MSPRPPADSFVRPYEVAIVGNDAVLAALPSRSMQLAHALHACGFDVVVPVSWGEELVARQVLEIIAARDEAPAIFCACPLQHARLMAAGSELSPYLISLASPTVATARYLRALHPTVPLRITVIGGCPDVQDPSIDVRIAPLELFPLLDARGIVLSQQPAVFESVIPPDRRRHFSLPGGCPTPRMLELRVPERRLVTITDADFAAELAEVLLGGECVLVDLSPRLACVCCGGFVLGARVRATGRDQILLQEPPRAPLPFLEYAVELNLSLAGEAADSDAQVEPPGRGLRNDALSDRVLSGRGLSDHGLSGDGLSSHELPDHEPTIADLSVDQPVGQESSGSEPLGNEPSGNEPSRDEASRNEASRDAAEGGTATQRRDHAPFGSATVPDDRTQVERPRIAVTPAAAVRPATTRRRGAAVTPVPPPAAVPMPESGARAIPIDHALPLRGDSALGGGDATAPTSFAERSDESRGANAGVHGGGEGSGGVSGDPAANLPGDAEGGWRGDVAIPMAPVREGMPDLPPEGTVHLPGDDPWREVGVSGGQTEMRSHIGSVAPRAPRARPRSLIQRFHLTRGQLHPRALSLGGKVLPRAYIRHLPVPTQLALQVEAAEPPESQSPSDAAHDAPQNAPDVRDSARDDARAEFRSALGDVEMRLELCVEPPPSVAAPLDAGPADARGGREDAGASDDEGASDAALQAASNDDERVEGAAQEIAPSPAAPSSADAVPVSPEVAASGVIESVNVSTDVPKEASGVAPGEVAPGALAPGEVAPGEVEETAVEHSDEERPGAETLGVEGIDAEPRRAEPIGAEPIGAEPIGAEPIGAEPIGAEPIGAEPMGRESSAVGPTSAQPTSAQARDAEPGESEPPSAEPLGSGPLGDARVAAATNTATNTATNAATADATSFHASRPDGAPADALGSDATRVATHGEAGRVVSASAVRSSDVSATGDKASGAPETSAASDATVTLSAPGAMDASRDDLLARVRQRQREQGREVLREIPASHPPREPGAIAVVIASAILVLALLVALAVIFRRAPTAPW